MSSGSFRCHLGSHQSGPVPAETPWLIWVNESRRSTATEITTTKAKQTMTKPRIYFMGYIYISNYYCRAEGFEQKFHHFIWGWRDEESRPTSNYMWCYCHSILEVSSLFRSSVDEIALHPHWCNTYLHSTILLLVLFWYSSYLPHVQILHDWLLLGILLSCFYICQELKWHWS